MKPLRLIAANNTFGALNLMIDVLGDKCAVFITAPETNGLMPEVHGLPDQVEDGVALIVESSGSTGTPKRIELSKKALMASAIASAERLGGHGQWLLALPINFVAGSNILVRSVIAETQPVMMNTRVPFTPDAFIRSAGQLNHSRTYSSLVPVQLSKLLAYAKLDDHALKTLRRFRAILVGGQAPNLKEVLEFKELGVNIVVSYGMTETAGGCVYDQLPLKGVEISMEQGQIAVAGDVLANNLGEKFLTSDLGNFENGRLEVLGRADRVIISGGLKVSLDLIEQRLLAEPGVNEISAESIETLWGQSVGIAYVGPKDFDFSFLETEFSSAAKPARVIRLGSLPRLISGKPDRLAIQSLLAN
jgi:O-succinylbenzoic acid--CoA ligase